MTCNTCGAQAAADAVYCPKCGDRLDRRDGEQPLKKGGGAADAGEPTAAERLRSKIPNAADDEEVELWQGGYSGKAMIGSWIGAALLSIAVIAAAVAAMVFLSPMLPITWPIVLIVAGAILLIIWVVAIGGLALKKLGVHYELTSQRFIHRRGVLSRVTDRIEVIDIDDVTYSQGLVQRMLGVGTIKIISSDRSHPELNMRGIDQVSEVADLIDNVRRKERRRRGLHIEAI